MGTPASRARPHRLLPVWAVWASPGSIVLGEPDRQPSAHWRGHLGRPEPPNPRLWRRGLTVKLALLPEGGGHRGLGGLPPAETQHSLLDPDSGLRWESRPLTGCVRLSPWGVVGAEDWGTLLNEPLHPHAPPTLRGPGLWTAPRDCPGSGTHCTHGPLVCVLCIRDISWSHSDHTQLLLPCFPGQKVRCRTLGWAGLRADAPPAPGPWEVCGRADPGALSCRCLRSPACPAKGGFHSHPRSRRAPPRACPGYCLDDLGLSTLCVGLQLRKFSRAE